MDVYRQAADIIRVVREGRGTAKALCLRKEMQKKKQTYAVVCETLRHWDVLHDVLEAAEFYKYYPRANRELAVCMTYDVVLGKGVHTRSDTTARAVAQSAAYLREAYWQLRKHHDTTPAEGHNNDNNNDMTHAHNTTRTAGATSATGAEAAVALPRYARVNTLKVSVDELVTRLRRSQQQQQQQNDEQMCDEDDSAVGDGRRRRGGGNTRRRRRTLPAFTLDPVVPSLLVFPAGTDLHAHPAVRSGQLVLQDRASCLPACVLLDAVPVERTCTGNNNKNKRSNSSNSSDTTRPLEYVLDACAAPGNKTTQLAALGAAQHIRIMATERDERRAALLQQRVHSLGAADYVNVVHGDVFDLSSDDRAAAEAILLDPSCSASGVVTRVDVHVAQQRQQQQQQQQQQQEHRNDATTPSQHTTGHKRGRNDAVSDRDGATTTTTPWCADDDAAAFACDGARIDKLAQLQRKLLTHALLSFDNCRVVVYSTCSVHEAENEAVVRHVMRDARVRGRGWTLSNILPGGLWRTRGHRRLCDDKNDDDASDVDVPLHYTIRCDPVADATNGFYVARFDRELPLPSSSS